MIPLNTAHFTHTDSTGNFHELLNAHLLLCKTCGCSQFEVGVSRPEPRYVVIQCRACGWWEPLHMDEDNAKINDDKMP